MLPVGVDPVVLIHGNSVTPGSYPHQSVSKLQLCMADPGDVGMKVIVGGDDSVSAAVGRNEIVGRGDVVGSGIGDTVRVGGGVGIGFEGAGEGTLVGMGVGA